MLVAIGSLREGERVPSSRALAHTLGVSENAVSAAYDDLKAANVFVSEASRWTTVAAGARSSSLLSAVIDDSLTESVALMRSLGVPRLLLEYRMREIVAELYAPRGAGADD